MASSMLRIPLTENIARGIAWDAATAQMRKAGRKAWNQDDANLNAETLDRIWVQPLLEIALRAGGRR